jgi:hypothetical protein
MHRLVIVSGPNRGSSFNLVEGENLIGRQVDNQIVLSSSRVSKRHCAIVVHSGEIYLKDEGSTNGTFVNGALTRQQTLRSGDKLGVGEFVLEFVKSPAAQPALRDPGASMAMQPGFPSYPSAPPTPTPRVTLTTATFRSGPAEIEEPEDLLARLQIVFEGKFMPGFYGMLMKNEFRSVVGVIFLIAGLVSIVGAVMPMQDLASQGIRREALIRARLLAREVSDRFGPNIAAHTESQIDLSQLEGEDSVRSVALVNTNLQIIAPQARLNQIYAGGVEGEFALEMAKKYRNGRETGEGRVVQERDVAIWVEPIKTLDPRQVRASVAAMAVVSIDFSRNALSTGGLEVAYATSIGIGGLALLLVYLIVMRLASKPYEVLNEDLDRVLRGEMSKVTQEFKVPETQGLWDNINAAVQRIPKGGGEISMDGGMVQWESQFEPFRVLAEHGKFALAGFDPSLNFVLVNELFTEVSGIRSDSYGQTVSAVGDQALSALVVDLSRAVSNSSARSATDRFSFQGDDYEVVATGVQVKDQIGLVVFFKRKAA